MIEIKKGAIDNQFIKWFYELNRNSGQIAGGKGASLGEMFNNKFPVPPGFAVTTNGYWHFVESAGIKDKINEILESIDVDNTEELETKAKQIREIMIKAEMPDDLKQDILEAYEDLSIDKKSLENASTDALNILKQSNDRVFVAVRSSATTEDLADASFAGQQETYLNVKGDTEIIEKVKRVLASLFTARAIYYRKKKGFSKEKFALSAIVQKMIDSDVSGVMFSNNPIKQNDNVLIEAVFGLGEGIVSGKIKPDNYEVDRDLKIIEKKVAIKKLAMTRDSQGENKTIKLTEEKSKEQVISEGQIKQIANYGIKLEKFYGLPQDIEWAIEANEIYIIQSRPITTKAQAKQAHHKVEGEEILSGLAASPGIASGKVKIIKDKSELSKIQKGDILVTEMTDPDMVVTMQKSAAIITDEGGITSHAAIVSREMGIPAVVGTGDATEVLKEEQVVTVDGFEGKVHSGSTETVKAEVNPIVQTKTKIKVIVDMPEATERAAKSKAEGIGLTRLEGIIAMSGKHPLQFVKEGKEQEYSDIIKQGIEKIAQPFKEIWIRTSDIRSDEYSNLEGAPKETEGNPMLGNHGIRFSLKHPKIFEAELNAIKECAEKYPDKKFGFMMPQVISVEEVEKTKQISEKLGLKNVKMGIMVETPSSALIIKDLLKAGAEFASFGANDLTQYILAIDRNNEDVQYIYDEMHPAILNAMKRVIRTCKELNVESSICGQAGSRKPMVKFLVENRIDSISVNADAAQEISQYVAELEKELPDKSENKNNDSISNNKNKQENSFHSNNQSGVVVGDRDGNNTKTGISGNYQQKFKKKFKHKHKFNKHKNRFQDDRHQNNQHNQNQHHKNPQELIREIDQKVEHEKREVIEDIQKDKQQHQQTQNERQQPQNQPQPPQPTPEPPTPKPEPQPEPVPEPTQKREIPSYVADTGETQQEKVEGISEPTGQIITDADEYESYENNFQQKQVEPKQHEHKKQKHHKELDEDDLDEILNVF